MAACSDARGTRACAAAGLAGHRGRRNTLIVAPTGSGKTLAAFLAALDLLWRTPRGEAGVRILYVSPLKALNEDIRRNLEVPLAGVLEPSGMRTAPEPASGGRPQRRYSGSRSRPAGPQAARYPDHDARIASPHAHQPGPAILAGLST